MLRQFCSDSYDQGSILSIIQEFKSRLHRFHSCQDDAACINIPVSQPFQIKSIPQGLVSESSEIPPIWIDGKTIHLAIDCSYFDLFTCFAMKLYEELGGFGPMMKKISSKNLVIKRLANCAHAFFKAGNAGGKLTLRHHESERVMNCTSHKLTLIAATSRPRCRARART